MDDSKIAAEDELEDKKFEGKSGGGGKKGGKKDKNN